MASPPIDVFVFGVGRSGTTMAYVLIQEILRDACGGAVLSSYEPFIWNAEVFDDLYESTKSLFGRTSSLDIEGIHRHLNMRLFVEKVRSTDHRGLAFFRRFSPDRPGGGSHVAKLIRANGRMAVFRDLNPSAKFVLMVRNPVDNVNSVKHKFSYFGDDFYPSDFHRFCDELGAKLLLDPETATWAEKQAEYSFQMSRAALEFTEGDSQSLVFEYDRFVRTQRESVAKLCDHLDVEFRDSYMEQLDSPVGSMTPRIALSEVEYRSIAHYEDRYQELCDHFGLDRPVGSEDVHRHYRGHCDADCVDPHYDGLTTNRLRNVIREKDEAIKLLREQVASLLKGTD